MYQLVIRVVLGLGDRAGGRERGYIVTRVGPLVPFQSTVFPQFPQFQRVEEKWFLPKILLLTLVEMEITVLIGVSAVYPM